MIIIYINSCNLYKLLDVSPQRPLPHHMSEYTFNARLVKLRLDLLGMKLTILMEKASSNWQTLNTQKFHSADISHPNVVSTSVLCILLGWRNVHCDNSNQIGAQTSQACAPSPLYQEIWGRGYYFFCFCQLLRLNCD